MTRFAGELPRQVFSNDAAVYDGSVIGDIRRYDDANFQEKVRTSRRARYALRDVDRENPRVKKPELPETTDMNKRRDATIAARKQKELQAQEEARIKALYS